MNKYFIVGFITGFLIFIGINLLAIHLSSDCGINTVFGGSPCADGITRAGWPLQFYESGGFMYQTNFNSLYFWIDIGLGIALAALTGWMVTRRQKALPK